MYLLYYRLSDGRTKGEYIILVDCAQRDLPKLIEAGRKAGFSHRVTARIGRKAGQLGLLPTDVSLS
jgi:hypothetical protein